MLQAGGKALREIGNDCIPLRALPAHLRTERLEEQPGSRWAGAGRRADGPGIPAATPAHRVRPASGAGAPSSCTSTVRPAVYRNAIAGNDHPLALIDAALQHQRGSPPTGRSPAAIRLAWAPAMRSTWLKAPGMRVWTKHVEADPAVQGRQRAAQLKISEVRADQQHAARGLRHDPHFRMILDAYLRVVDAAEPCVLLVDDGAGECSGSAGTRTAARA